MNEDNLPPDWAPSQEPEQLEPVEQVKHPEQGVEPSSLKMGLAESSDTSQHSPDSGEQPPSAGLPQSVGQARSSEVKKVRGVLRVVPVAQPQLGEGAQQQWVGQPLPAGQQKYCPYCRGGNPLNGVTCVWCGRLMEGPPLPNREPSRNLFEAYKAAVLHSSAEGFASEVPGATWARIWLGLGVMTVAYTLLQLLIRALFFGDAYSRIFSTVMTGSPGAGGSSGSPAGVGSGASGTTIPAPLRAIFTNVLDFMQGPWLPIINVLLTVAGFFLGALLLYGISRLFGGVGRTRRFGPDFKVFAYLYSLVSVPLGLITSALALVPVAGGCVGFLLAIYSIRLQYFVVRASMQMTRSKAQSVIIAEFVLWFALGIIITVVVFTIALSALFSSMSQHLGSQIR